MTSIKSSPTTPRLRVYQAQVAAGIIFLNTHTPAWREQIDLRRLDLSNCLDCILGQLYGSYGCGLGRLFPHSWSRDEIARLGFNTPFPRGTSLSAAVRLRRVRRQMATLTNEWKRQLTEAA